MNPNIFFKSIYKLTNKVCRDQRRSFPPPTEEDGAGYLLVVEEAPHHGRRARGMGGWMGVCGEGVGFGGEPKKVKIGRAIRRGVKNFASCSPRLSLLSRVVS